MPGESIVLVIGALLFYFQAMAGTAPEPEIVAVIQPFG